MELFLFYVVSVCLCFGAQIKYELSMFKDIADAGYKVDIKKLSLLQKDNPLALKKSILSLVTPLWNLIYVTKKISQYSVLREHLFDSLSVMGLLEEMNEWEKKEYQKRPTGMQALMIPIQFQQHLDHSSVFEFEEEMGISKIYYEKAPETKEYLILQVEGPVGRLDEESQKDILIGFERHVKQKVKQVYQEILDEHSEKDGQKSDEELERLLLEELFERLDEEYQHRQEESKGESRVLRKKDN